MACFANAVEDNPFMAGAVHGIGEPDVVVNVGISGPGAVRAIVESLPPEADLTEVAEAIKATSFKITRAGELIGREVARRLGLAGKLTIGVVTGDDLLGRVDTLLAAGHELRNLDTGRPFRDVRDRVQSVNAYLGAGPVVEALRRGADIVITGRVTDTGLTLGPMMHEFGWAPDAWDLIASGTVAGHTIECGAQCSGGNCLVDWQRIPDLANVGYPIAEAYPDGTVDIIKHPGTGGRITVAGVTEQLVYEMGDPRTYITPDGIADFTSIRLQQKGKDRVRMSEIRGRPATDSLKVSAAYFYGYKAVGTLVYQARAVS